MCTEEWLLCSVCQNKTRTMVRRDTELKNFPLFCPKCKQETLINVKQLNMFMSDVHGKRPENLEIADINAERVEAFLDWLESERSNSIATRNIRLAAPDGTTAKGKRDMALLCLIYDNGCRVQELAYVRIRDIRFTVPSQVTLTGKASLISFKNTQRRPV